MTEKSRALAAPFFSLDFLNLEPMLYNVFVIVISMLWTNKLDFLNFKYILGKGNIALKMEFTIIKMATFSGK